MRNLLIVTFLLAITPAKYSLVQNNLLFTQFLSGVLLLSSLFQVSSLVKAVLNFVMSTCLLFIVAVLFGVQPLISFEKTISWAAFMSALILPLIPKDFMETVTGKTRNSKIIISTLIGSWFGAFVIPLDWATEWQVWPIPNTVMSVVGLAVGHFITYFTSAESRKSK